MAEFKQRLKSVTPVEMYAELAAKPADGQAEFFLKSFIFALGDGWKEVPNLCKEFKKLAKDSGDNENFMNHIQASNFLQMQGKTRTGMQRKHELDDVDLNKDGKISFTEYLLLHYKVMILKEFYKRHESTPVEDLSNDGIGLTGVGQKLLEELLTMPEQMSKELELAIESFAQTKRDREAKVKSFEEKVKLGGIKGMAAQNELEQLQKQDMTELNRIELTLSAAKRKCAKAGTGGDDLLKKQQEEMDAEAKAATEANRANLKARMGAFEGK